MYSCFKSGFRCLIYYYCKLPFNFIYKIKIVRSIKILAPTFFVFILSVYGNAQTNKWIVNAGESIKDDLGDSVIYRYPEFTPGVVYYKNGTFSRAPLNFNLITGEMEFISPSKDTLAIANESTIKYLIIQSDTFYYDKVFIELVHSNAKAKLGKLEIIKLTDVKKEGAYGQMSSTSAITTVSNLYNDNKSFYSNSQSYKLTEKTDLSLQKEIFYFIGNSTDNFLPAAKRNVDKLFGNKSLNVEPFIKENKIAFNKENDLIELIDFLSKI